MPQALHHRLPIHPHLPPRIRWRRAGRAAWAAAPPCASATARQPAPRLPRTPSLLSPLPPPPPPPSPPPPTPRRRRGAAGPPRARGLLWRPNQGRPGEDGGGAGAVGGAAPHLCARRVQGRQVQRLQLLGWGRRAGGGAGAARSLAACSLAARHTCVRGRPWRAWRRWQAAGPVAPPPPSPGPCPCPSRPTPPRPASPPQALCW